jgi:hypothetical protein
MRSLSTINKFAFAALVAIVLAPESAFADTCFEPLLDQTSRDPKNWIDIASKPPIDVKLAHGVKRLLRLSNGKDANIDYYFVRFAQPPGKSINAVFKDLRLNFPLFAKADGTRYTDFKPYPFANTTVYTHSGPQTFNKSEDDKDRATNTKLWESDVPTGALMSFALGTGFINSFLRTAAAYFKVKLGDLQVTCASTTQFMFSTVESERGGIHPVAGNRGFGIKDNNDGTWTFYSKATDQVSDFGGNVIPGVFCKGHNFWLGFYPAMMRYLNANKMHVQEFFVGNHGPAPYPLQPGTTSPVLDCTHKWYML